MQTNFSITQLANPAVAHSESILRSCVHCGFCTATCPTYQVLGDELDSPRGRIYLIKNILEQDRPADQKSVKHIDRCLSCLSCMTTCPSGVHYMHLVDHARAHIEQSYKRPLLDRIYRNVLAAILPYPKRFRLALNLARMAKPLKTFIPSKGFTRPMRAMLELAPAKLPPVSQANQPGIKTAQGKKNSRVAIHSGCAQSVLDPAITTATIELLTRFGVEVVILENEVCCGSLVHHMGREQQAELQVIENLKAWKKELDGDGLDAIIITASGCGTTIKDYGHMLRRSDEYAELAATCSGLTKDITEFLTELDLPPSEGGNGKVVAYHSACSMQHGQKITDLPKRLLTRAGFSVRDIPEGHLCCGSAGTYNILQTEIADQLKQRKLDNIRKVNPEIIAAGNIGCITQIASGANIPVIHTVQLLNWSYGGSRPKNI